jgi:protein-disulfide isomerase
MENQTNVESEVIDQNQVEVGQEIINNSAEGSNKKNGVWVPIIIIICIAVLLFALIKVSANNNNTSLQLPGGQKFETAEQAQQKLDDAKNQANIPDQKLSPTDHTQGNINARIVIFEYSDLDCPYCVRFHGTMKQLVADYPNDVLWVYRHFPLDNLHPKARIESVASECVAQIGGNNAFWQFIDSAFAFTSSNIDDPMPTLINFAGTAGVGQKAFDACITKNISDKKIDAIITNQQNIGAQSGTQGTPYNIILDRQTGAIYPAPGAQDLDTMHEIIKTILAE